MLDKNIEYQRLVVDLKGRKYDLGYVNTFAYITVWPFKPDMEVKDGKFLRLQKEQDHIPDMRFGKVVAVGEGSFPESKFFARPLCRVGDWVFYRRFENNLFGIGSRPNEAEVAKVAELEKEKEELDLERRDGSITISRRSEIENKIRAINVEIEEVGGPKVHMFGNIMCDAVVQNLGDDSIVDVELIDMSCNMGR
jgi:hypothetical protein